MNVSEQVSMILDIANLLRRSFKQEEYEKVIIPMTICRRFEYTLSKTKAAVVGAYNGILISATKSSFENFAEKSRKTTPHKPFT